MGQARSRPEGRARADAQEGRAGAPRQRHARRPRHAASDQGDGLVGIRCDPDGVARHQRGAQAPAGRVERSCPPWSCRPQPPGGAVLTPPLVSA